MRHFYMGFMILNLIVFCIGCSKEAKGLEEDIQLEAAERIDITGADDLENVWKVVDSQEEINRFVDALQVEQWELTEFPDEAVVEHMYELFQTGTVKLGESQQANNELAKVGTIISYEDIPYLELQIKNLTLHFKVPKEVATFLSEYRDE